MQQIDEDIKYLNNSYVAKANMLKYTVEHRGNNYYLFLNNEIAATGTAEEIEARVHLLSDLFSRRDRQRGSNFY